MLGFSSFCESRSAQELAAAYQQILASIVTATTYGTDGEDDHVLIFSDTVVLAEPRMEPRTEAVRHLFRLASLLIHNSLLELNRFEHPPFRGCVSFGECIFRKNASLFSNSDCRTSLVLGKAVARASAWEKKQKWVGASIVPSDLPDIRIAFPGLLEQLVEEGYLVDYDVPTEDGLVATLAINCVTSGHSDHILRLVRDREQQLPRRKRVSIAELEDSWRQ